jgi:hypothetical protein
MMKDEREQASLVDLGCPKSTFIYNETVPFSCIEYINGDSPPFIMTAISFAYQPIIIVLPRTEI